jgi:hypothetical protein
MSGSGYAWSVSPGVPDEADKVGEAVRWENRVHSLEEATVLRQSSRARAYRNLSFIFFGFIDNMDGKWMPDVTFFYFLRTSSCIWP